MDEKNLIVRQYKDIVKCFIFFVLAVTLYIILIYNFPEAIFVGKLSLYLMFIHYLFLLLLIITFLITIGIRLYRLSKVLKEAEILTWHPVLVVFLYLLSNIIPLLVFCYMAVFWIFANKFLKRRLNSNLI